ncbi:trypco2 family protein [Streptomyces sp. FXJ1.4098]|uniref:trypco2 family protein n=1 Tax=Streptomyces sp. NPDC020845 TaxID=3365096 RepID=UPI00299BF8FA|nr:trypco2 family protein [Streptomyces sp. FXJ1.4098]
MTLPVDDIELADAVEAIRDGLLAATSRATGSPLRFEMGEIQMEFSVELRREARGKGAVKAWVVNASTEGAIASTRIQKVYFTLKPKNVTTNAGWDISNETEGDASRFEDRN